MAISRGKPFENRVKRDLLKVPLVLVERLYDVTSGNKGQRTPSDFIVYKNPYMTYLECKSIKGNSIGYDKISQLDDLIERLEFNIPGVRCWIIIWFIDKKKTYIMDAMTVKKLSMTSNRKSLSTQDCEKFGIEVPAKYPRVYGDYDFCGIFD